MKRKNKAAQAKSLNLALYFGLLVLFIVIISIAFKFIDVVRKSKFDGQNRFTVAVINKSNVEFISLSPREGTLTKLKVDKVLNDKVSDIALFDAFVKTSLDFDQNPKSFFVKLFLNSKGNKSNLTILDYIRLSLFSQGVQGDKVISEDVSVSQTSRLLDKTSNYFVDPIILDEKTSIQIVNATGIPGLGNKYARLISGIGGNIALVNSSKEIENNSKILFKTDNYTVGRLSKILNIKKEKQEDNSISDVIIIFGRDLEEKGKF